MGIAVGFAGSRMKYWGNVWRMGWKIHELIWKILDIIGEVYCRSDMCIEVHHGAHPLSIDSIVSCISSYHPKVSGEVAHPPDDWSSRECLLKRDMELVEDCDIIVTIFVNKLTRGTKYVEELARRLGKQYVSYMVTSSSIRVLGYRLSDRLIKLVNIAQLLKH